MKHIGDKSAIEHIAGDDEDEHWHYSEIFWTQILAIEKDKMRVRRGR